MGKKVRGVDAMDDYFLMAALMMAGMLAWVVSVVDKNSRHRALLGVSADVVTKVVCAVPWEAVVREIVQTPQVGAHNRRAQDEGEQ